MVKSNKIKLSFTNLDVIIIIAIIIVIVVVVVLVVIIITINVIVIVKRSQKPQKKELITFPQSIETIKPIHHKYLFTLTNLNTNRHFTKINNNNNTNNTIRNMAI